MKRITKLIGSLILSAAVFTASSVSSFADTAAGESVPVPDQGIQTIQIIQSISAERTDEGVKITWENVPDMKYMFLMRENGGTVSDFWLISCDDEAFVDTAAPDDECTYYIQAMVSTNGETFFDGSGRTSVPAVSGAEKISERLDAGLKIANGKAVLSWNKVNASGYVVVMDGKAVYDTQSNDITSYTAAVANYSKHTFTVRSYSDSGIIEESAPMVTTSIDTILNSARTDQTRSFTITNKQSAANSTAVKSLSDHDIAVIEKFAAEHFTADMTDAQKIQAALAWVNRNVRYAQTSADWALIGGKSYADAIFTYRTGQCAQYNGAMVSLLRYMGYDANMILGFRGNSYSRWQHYWGEIEIDGLRFIIEAGNYGSSGSWSYLLLPYSRTDGRFIMYN